MKRPGRGPIQPAYTKQMNGVAKAIDHFFNGEDDPKKVGFALLLFEFGEIDGGRVNYISNADRTDMLAAMREFLARAEGRFSEDSGHA